MANDHARLELPVTEVNPPNSTTFVGIPVDLRAVPPNMVVPNTTEDSQFQLHSMEEWRQRMIFLHFLFNVNIQYIQRYY